MRDTPRVYVACLASYNNGVLHGEWVDAIDADEIRETIAQVLRTSRFPNVYVTCPDCDGTGHVYDSVTPCAECGGKGEVPSAEEYAIHDYDGLPSSFGEWPDLDKLAEFAVAYEEHGEAFRLWWENESRDEVDVDAFQEAYAGTFDTVADWADDYLDQTGILDRVPEDLRAYFDTERWAEDQRLNGGVWFARGDEGVHVFTD